MNDNLLEKPQASHSLAAANAYKGAILGLQGDVLHGWVIDNGRPEQRLVVEVFIDNASVALARADQYEPLAPEGDLFNGFTVQLRQKWLSDAQSISVKLANQELELNGVIFLPAAPVQDAAAVASQVWHTGGLRIAGWSWDPMAPRRHVEVTVREGNRIVSNITCNVHNQALIYRETSDHGFTLDLPWELADGKVHVLEVVNDLGQSLAGSPIRLCCWPEGIEGLLQKLDSTQDPATVALLNKMAHEQTLRLPKSAGWHHYPQWHEAFQHLKGLKPPAIQGQIGLLLVTEGDAALEKISLASLGDDRAKLHDIAKATSSDLLPALQQLLDKGCNRILPLKAGDRIAHLALPHFAALLDNNSAWAFADCDRDGLNGERSLPWLKPVWDLDLFIGADIFSTGSILGAGILKQGLELLATCGTGSSVNWHDLFAAVALATQQSQAVVTHMPRVLYHRSNQASISPEQAETSNQRFRAVEWLCETLSPGASVSRVPEYPALLRAHWPLPETLPRVSLIVPTRDQYKLLHTCVEGLLNETEYPDLEIIVIDNQSSDPETLNYLAELKCRGVIVLDHPYPFNYSTINNRAAHCATGELIGLVNNDIEIIDPLWLKEMVAQLIRPGVGAVGAKLLWPNRMVQHGGVIVGINGLAAHTGNNLHESDAGYLGSNQITRQQSAVTAACLLVRKELFFEIGGLDEIAFPVAFNDVDLCLKIRSQHLNIIWCASAKLVHAESASRGKDETPEKRARALREQELFIRKWSATDHGDPYYHAALSLDYLSGPYGGLSVPPRNTNLRTTKPTYKPTAP